MWSRCGCFDPGSAGWPEFTATGIVIKTMAEGLVQALAFTALLARSTMSLSWCCSTRPRHKSTAGRRVALFPRSLSQRDDAQQARTKEPSRRRFGDTRTVRLDHEVGKLMETGTRRPGLVPVY